MKRLLLTLLLLCCAAPAAAGTLCEQRPVPPQALAAAARLATRVHDQLESQQPRVAIAARAGSDLSRYGLVYSHAGFILRDHPKGRWRVVHELNHCGTERSELFDEGLINFFTDDPHELRVLLIVPSPALQAALEQRILSGTADRLHEPRYSVIANPYSTRYQNSNQWMLETIVAAQSVFLPVATRADAQAALKWSGYSPDYITLSPAERLGASLFRANVRFDDHAEDARDSGRFPVVTVRSVRRYLEQTDGAPVHEMIQR